MFDNIDEEQIVLFTHLMSNIKSAFERLEATSLAMSEDYQQLFFDKNFDKKARILVDIINSIYTKGYDFCFQFLGKGDKLN